MARMMADPAYRTQAWDRRYEGASGQVNRRIDDIVDRFGLGPMPYSGPEYGGIEAEALLLLRDPGPKTQIANRGSGFLSIENNDESAQRLNGVLSEVGLAPQRLVSWNVYPWYINRAPRVAEQRDGAKALRMLLDGLPRVRAVVLMGSTAQSFWPDLFEAQFPSLAASFRTFDSLLCSGRGITNGGRHSREVGVEKVTTAYRSLRAFLDQPA